MASAAFKSYGTLLKYGPTPVTVAELLSVTRDGPEVETIDVTSMDSASGWREFMATLKDAGSISFQAHLLADSPTTVYAQLGNKVSWVIVYTSGDTFTCDGILTSFGIDEATIDGKLTYTGEIKLTGAPVWS